MKAIREELLDKVIAVYGFEHELTVQFAKACEEAEDTDEMDMQLAIVCGLYIGANEAGLI